MLYHLSQYVTILILTCKNDNIVYNIVVSIVVLKQEVILPDLVSLCHPLVTLTLVSCLGNTTEGAIRSRHPRG